MEIRINGEPCNCRICIRLKEINRRTQDKLKKACGIDSATRSQRQEEREKEPWWNRI